MVNKTKKICAIALAALMGVSVFAGCNSATETNTNSSSGNTASTSTGDTASADSNADPLNGEGANGTISLKVWGPETYQDLLRTQCDRFIQEYSAYGTIEIDVVPQGEDDAATNLLTDAEAAADVFGFACDNINKLVTAQALMPVMGADAEEVIANNNPNPVAAATVADPNTGEDTIYAYPETGDNSYCLVYDKSVVSEEQAKTLEGVLQACKDANKKFVMDAGNGFYSCMFAFTGGLTIDGYEENGSTQKFSEYDEAQVVSTLKAFHDLFTEYSDYFLNGGVEKVVDGFKSGTVAAGIDGSWNFTSSMEALGDNAGFAVLPTINVDGTDTQIINMFGYKLFGVNAKTQYPNTSIELAKFLSGEECQKERAEQLNWSPSNIAVAESDTVKNNEGLAAILAQSDYSVPQMNVSATFWTPFATLGSKVADTTVDYTDDEYKTLVETTIANVRDE